MSKIKVKINGKEVEVDESSTIQGVIEQRQITGNMFVIEKNLQIIQKDKYNEVVVNPNDSLEIVGFFGGG